MIEIQQAESSDMFLLASRPLWGLTINPLKDAKRSAKVRCGNGHLASLDDHTIAADGTVSPSLDCPEGGCGWHVHARLVGWKP